MLHRRLILTLLGLPLFGACGVAQPEESIPALIEAVDAADPIAAGTVEDSTTGSTVTGDPAVLQDDARTRIEVLVAYTPAARAYAGSTDAMRAAINTYIELTNTTYTNSDANTYLGLVGTTEVSYSEASSISTDLSLARGTSDGVMDSLHSLRNTVQADLVCLIRRGPAGGAAGVAYLGNSNLSFAASAFSVVADNYAASNLTFPHEVGHSLGCNHDRDNAGGASAPGYNYGHRFTGSDNVQYRTVMAYAPGMRIPKFSNPSIYHAQRFTGVAAGLSGAADNAQAIELNAAYTRTYRNGTTRLGSTIVGDLDNDGRADLILTDRTTGERHFWKLTNLARSRAAIFTTVNPVWRLAGTGCFNGDADLIWENTSTGQRVVWRMNGTTRASAITLATVDPAWRIAGTGDFNNDQLIDILFEHTTTGQHVVWTYSHFTKTGAITLPTVAPPWRVAAVADFNADAKADLVWENATTGQHVIWLMNGATQTSAVTIGTVAAPWQIVGAGDFNGDGKPDIVWENSTTWQRVVWYYDGTTKLGAGTFPAAPGN